jgi:hypothetical protein
VPKQGNPKKSETLIEKAVNSAARQADAKEIVDSSDTKLAIQAISAQTPHL